MNVRLRDTTLAHQVIKLLQKDIEKSLEINLKTNQNLGYREQLLSNLHTYFLSEWIG